MIILSLSGQGWFDYHIKDTSGNSGRLYFHGCGSLEQHGKQCHRDCFLLNLVQMPGSNPAWARLSVAEIQGKEEYKNYPMTAVLSCAGRLLLNSAKCPALPRQISFCCYFLLRTSRKAFKVALWEASQHKWTVTDPGFANLTSLTAQHRMTEACPNLRL